MVGQPFSVGEVKEAHRILGEAVEEGNTLEWVEVEVASKEVIDTMITEADGVVEEGGLGGKTTTSHSEIEMLQSISSLIGRCSKRSISTV